MQGFLLGLASGSTCLAYCAPAIVPYLLGEGKSSKHNVFLLGQFLTGRLFGYLLFALLAYGISSSLAFSALQRELLLGPAYILLAIVLFRYSRKPKSICMAHTLGTLTPKITGSQTSLMPLLLGMLTGINLCPPFLLVFTEAAGTQTLAQAMLYFSSFFLGTALYFLPLPFLGFLKQYVILKDIGKMIAVLMSFYYLYTGMIMLIGGMTTL